MQDRTNTPDDVTAQRERAAQDLQYAIERYLRTGLILDHNTDDSAEEIRELIETTQAEIEAE